MDKNRPQTPPSTSANAADQSAVNDVAIADRRAESAKTLLSRLMKIVAVITWLAFGAAFMPEKWFVEISDFLQVSPFPQTSLGFYLARHLSLVYAFVGVAMWVVAFDLDRYLPLVRKSSKMIIVFGGLQLMIDFFSNMPLWWTFSESLSTIAGGLLMLVLAKRAGVAA